ncbi:MAG: LysE family translocator [Hyphomicrobiales bacterium]|nr:LysE family translocator [Hyphomicrobiales bacterium]
MFLTVSLLPALSPGPGMLLALSNSLRYGPKATLYSAIGNSLGLLLLGFAVAFGLAAILAISALAFTILKVLGAAYLVYLGVKLWRDGKSLSLADTDQGRFNPHWLLQQGFLVSITNPKAIILLAALIPPFVDHTQAILPQVTVMSVSYAITCFIIHLLLAQAGGRIRVLLSSAWRRKAVQRGLGSMFIGFGLALTAANR